MALTVNTNVSALNAQRHTEDSQLAMSEAMERLASGKRINSARDDAAGLAISARMQAQISGLNQAVRNSNDAISLVQTAEGALQEYTEILQRVRELAIQAANGAATNADRVNLHKEVSQLQDEMNRIANTTRFNGELLLNGSFIQKDFQIGQSNQEEISVNIGDLRPEKIGAYTQQTLDHVGFIPGKIAQNNMGNLLANVDNGVESQVISVRVGDEAARTVSIAQGDDARTIADKLNQSGAQINSKAFNTVAVYIENSTAGGFKFNLSSSSAPDIVDAVEVGSSGDKNQILAAEVNARFADHNIKAEVKTDANGTTYVELTQTQGYDINIDAYAAVGGSTSLDFGGKGVIVLDGTDGQKALALGGKVVIDAPQSFLMSSQDSTSSVIPSTRPALQFEMDELNIDATALAAKWSGRQLNFSVDDGSAVTTKTITMKTYATGDTFTDFVDDLNTKLADATNGFGLISGTTEANVRAEFEPSTNTFSVFSLAGNTDSTASISMVEVPEVITVDASDATEVILADNSFVTATAHGYAAGDKIRYDVASGGTPVTGLTDATEYFVVLDGTSPTTKFGLAATAAHAAAGTPLISLTALGTGNSTFTTITSSRLVEFSDVGFTTDSSTNTVQDQGGDPTPTETVRYVSQIDIATRDNALLTMTVVDAALETINANRAGLGAVANRLESTIQNLMTTSENTSASLSRVMDADFATESTALARAQVLQQASIAMLAQANASTQTVLRLLE